MAAIFNPKVAGQVFVQVATAMMNGEEIKDGVSIGDMGEIKVSGNTILSDNPVNLNIENTKIGRSRSVISPCQNNVQNKNTIFIKILILMFFEFESPALTQRLELITNKPTPIYLQ